MEGTITTIQRLSIHDGPGIRTTIFLKGCNLRCKWCHNPETWSFAANIQQLKEKCIICKRCISVCPSEAITLTNEGITINRKHCAACGQCATECLSGAIRVVGRVVDSTTLVEEIAADLPYFLESGGGVTISGGEPFCQLEFTTEVLKKCKNRGVHTAVETNLSCSTSKIEEVLPYVDMWLVDLKSADASIHKAQTGVDNRQIINNIKYLSDRGCRLVVRTPVIPHVNDRDEDIIKICEILSPLSVLKYELLPFHALGFDKFTQFGIENPIKEPIELEDGRIEHLRDVVEQYIK